MVYVTLMRLGWWFYRATSFVKCFSLLKILWGKKKLLMIFYFLLVFNQSCTFFGMDWCQVRNLNEATRDSNPLRYNSTL